MRRQVTWNDEADLAFELFADPLPGTHHPPDPDRLAEDVGFIIEALAERFDDQEDYGKALKRVALQEPVSAGLITVFARLVDAGKVEIVEFDAWPPGQPPDDPDEATN